MHAAPRQLLQHLRARSERPALVLDDGRTFSWAQLELLSATFPWPARTGERVVTFTEDRVGLLSAALACHRRGIVFVPGNPGYQSEERNHVVQDSGGVVLTDFGGAGLSRVMGDELDVKDEDVMLLIYTSGTTGKSKGCALTYANVAAAVSSLMSLWEVTEQDEIIHALPLFHVHGLCVAFHGALVTGARTRLLAKFSPQAVVDAVAKGGTVFMGVPTMYRRLLDHLEKNPRDGEILAKARLFTAGSAALPASDLEEFERYTGHRIVERYGMSETLITLSNPVRGERKAGTVGRPIPGVEIRVADEELLVKGPGVMRGYWQNAAATKEAFTADGFFKTGDLVRVDDDGYVTIVGRSSTDILKVGGYKISTREIEEKLASLAGLVECAVVGVPDREWGQQVVAVVVVDKSGPLASVAHDALLARIQQHVDLHAAKKPRLVHVVDALPRNAMGKVLKKKLADDVVAAAAAAAATATRS